MRGILGYHFQDLGDLAVDEPRWFLVWTIGAGLVYLLTVYIYLIMAEISDDRKIEIDSKRMHTYPLIRHSDMNDEMKTEAMELCVTACEKFVSNNESAAKMIKDTMDKKFGASWHAVVGESYGFEVTHELKNLLYMFFGGNIAIILWKCS